MTSLKSTLLTRFILIVLLHTAVTLICVYIITLYKLQKSAKWELAKFEDSLKEAIEDDVKQEADYSFYTLDVGEESRFSFWVLFKNGNEVEAGEKVYRLKEKPFAKGFNVESYKEFAVFRKSTNPKYDLYTSVHSELDLIDDVLWIFLLTLPILLIPALYFSCRTFSQLIMPLEGVSKTLQDIESGELQSRLNIRSKHIEIERLLNSLNQTLDFLESLFEKSIRFNAHAAHELNTPLTVIKGEIDLCLSGPEIIENYENCLLKVQEEVYRYRGMIESLLMISSPGGSYKEEFTDLCLKDSFNEIVNILNIMSKEKNIDLNLQIDASRQTGSEKLLKQAIFNLVENAIKYSPSGSGVNIVLSQERFSIEDQASKLSKDDQVNILQPFYRKSMEFSGVGLGLSIVAWICEIHCYKLSVSTTSKGNLFTINF